MTEPSPSELTHFDEKGQARMVDVGSKQPSDRRATAKCVVKMLPETLKRIRDGSVEKGDVLAIARVAGIMAAKRTPDLIPLCHPIALTSVEIDYQFPGNDVVEICVTTRTTDRTGVEMEAMTAASVCGLTIYDMCKSADRQMEILSLRLEQKSGGKSGTFNRRNDGDEPT